MSKKIMFLLSLFCSSCTIIASLPEPAHFIADQETKKENIPLTLDEKVSITDGIYALLQKKYALDEQLSLTRKKIRTKNTLTIGNVIATVAFTGILAGPALSINYLNKYVTPEKYQNFIDKISIGTAGFIGGVGALGLAKKGGKSVYDIFMYEKEQKRINLEIDKLIDNQKKIDADINNITNQYPEIFSTSSPDYDQEQTYLAFMNFYNDNKAILNKDNMNTFFLAHKNYSIKNLIDICKHKKINLILSAIKRDDESNDWFKSTGNLSLDIVGAILLVPWYLIFGALQAIEGNTLGKELKKIDTLNTIIKQLTNLASE